MIHYDYCDDEIKDKCYKEKHEGGTEYRSCPKCTDELNRFNEWLYDRNDGGWGFMNRLMTRMGYKSMNVDVDGSGNGLYYGIQVYRKK